MNKFFGIILAGAILSGCTDGKTTRRALENQGFTNIEITGWAPFSCADEDIFRTGFRAIGPTGRVVRGTVCSGFFKGATIRFD